MKRIIMVFLCGIALIASIGCMQVDTVVKVKTDGSGIIEETLLMRKDFLSQMKKMMQEMAQGMGQMMTEGEEGGSTSKDTAPGRNAMHFDIFDEAKLREKAGDKGDGVTYLSGSKIVTDEYEGYRALYAFEDINKIRINQNPGEKVPSGPPQEGSETDGSKKEFVVFALKKGSPAELVIRSPEPSDVNGSKDVPDEASPAADDKRASDMMVAQMKEMFRGMKISFAVEVEGDIIDTNATHREGSKVTVIEIDFGKLLEMPEEFRQFSQARPETVEETKLLMQKVPGMKVDLNKEIRIRFQ